MRLLGLVAVVAAAIWFGFIGNHLLDPRPVQRLLFIGHSRTYYHDMPEMVAKMAESADSPVRYEVIMQALPGATAKSHWKNAMTQRLLDEGKWDRVILQPDYVWRNDEIGRSDLFIYGQQLLAKAAIKSRPAIISDWTFRDNFYRKYGWNRSEQFQLSQSHYRALAYQTGAELIDVAAVWEDIRDEDLGFSLYKDDDHQTLHGSYLVALVVYAALSHNEVTKVSYVPWGMTDADAKLLRERVQASLPGS